MTNRRWIATMGFGTAVVVAGLATVAIGGPMSMHGNPERVEMMISKRVDAAPNDLKATDAQRQKVNTLEDRYGSRHEGVPADAEADPAGSPGALERRRTGRQGGSYAGDQRIDAIRVLAHQLADRAIELHATLTPEQRAQLAERVKHHRRPPGHGDAGAKAE